MRAKRIIGILGAVGILLSSIHWSVDNVYAAVDKKKIKVIGYEQVSKWQTNAHNLLDDSNKYGAMNSVLLGNKNIKQKK